MLGLEPNSPAGEAVPLVKLTITPTIELTTLLYASRSSISSLDLSASAGTLQIATLIPAGERWHVKSLWRSGSVASSRFGTVPEAGNGGTTWLSTAGASEQQESYDDLIMQAGDTIGLRTTGDPGDTAIIFHIWYLREVLGPA